LENDSVEYGLGFSTKLNEAFSVRLFNGAIYNSNKMNVYVQVYDDDGAFTIFNLPYSITVLNQNEVRNLTTLMDKLILGDTSFETNIILHEGSFQSSIQEVQRVASLLNEQSLSDKLGLILAGKETIFPQTYGPLKDYTGVMPVFFLNFDKKIFLKKSNILICF